MCSRGKNEKEYLSRLACSACLFYAIKKYLEPKNYAVDMPVDLWPTILLFIM